MSVPPRSPISTPAPDPGELRRALESLRPMLDAIPRERVATPPCVEPELAIGITNGALGRIQPLRAEVERELGARAVGVVDGLRGAVHAAWQAHVEASGEEARQDLRPEYDALLAAQRILLADAETLVLRGLLERSRLAGGRATKGYKQVATSVLYLVALFREEWPRIGEVTPTSADELTRLEQRARRLVDVVDRRRCRRDPQPARELRTRALVHLLEVYDEVRRILQYVRYHQGDADELAPSPYSRRHGRARPRRTKGAPVVEGPSSEGDGPPAE